MSNVCILLNEYFQHTRETKLRKNSFVNSKLQAGTDYYKRIVSSCLSHSSVTQMQYYCSLSLLSIAT